MSAAISVTGVLRPADWPGHSPHCETLTEEQALDAIIGHMQRDALSIGLLDDDLGPLHRHQEQGTCLYAWGNFTLASGLFRIDPISADGAARLGRAFADHCATRHYALAQEMERIEGQIIAALEAAKRTGKETAPWAERKPFLPRLREIEAELKAIYDAQPAAPASAPSPAEPVQQSLFGGEG